MSARAMRIKVNVADLIVKVEEAKAKALADYAKAEVAFAKAEAAWPVLRLNAFKKAYADARQGKFPRDRWGDRYTIPVPPKPEKPTLRVEQFDKDLAILKMATDESLSISTDDHFSRYL